MDWTRDFIIILAGSLITLGLFGLNMWLIIKRDGAESFLVSASMHLVALATAIFNLLRILPTAEDAILIGNAVAILCISYSFWRAIQKRKAGPEVTQ